MHYHICEDDVESILAITARRFYSFASGSRNQTRLSAWAGERGFKTYNYMLKNTSILYYLKVDSSLEETRGR